MAELSLTYKDHRPGWEFSTRSCRGEWYRQGFPKSLRGEREGCIWSRWHLSWRRWELSWVLETRRSFCLSISVCGSIIHLGVQSKHLEVILAFSPCFLFPSPLRPNSQQLLRLLPPECIWSLHALTISTAITRNQATIIPLKRISSLLTQLAPSTLGPILKPVFRKAGRVIKSPLRFELFGVFPLS